MRTLILFLLMSAYAWGQSGNALALSNPGAPVNPPPCAFIMFYIDANNGNWYGCDPATATWKLIGPGAPGATTWNSIQNPTGNLSLAMANWTTTFTWNAATGAGLDVWTMTDGAGNTGTGVLWKVDTAAGSAMKPFQASVNGNGVQMSSAGVLAKLGTGSINADQCNGAACGTVTNASWTGGLVSIATSTTTPAFTIAGTSGGIPYFSGATTWASSGALTANLPVIGGGAGAAPAVGTVSGNTTQFVTTTGVQTSGDCVKIDASGNHIANGSACGGAAGANTALSNLAAVSVNAALTPQTTLDLGSTTAPWKDLWLYGAGTYGTNNQKITSTAPTAPRVFTLPNADSNPIQPFTCTNQVATAGAATGVFTCTTITSAYTSGTFTATAHNLFSLTHGDTVAASPVRGDIIIADATPAWTKLALGAATAGRYAKSDGTDVILSSGSASGVGACGANTWASTLNGDAAPTCTQPAFSNLSGALGSTQLTGTSGGVPFFSAANTYGSSAALTANAFVFGGGAGTAPLTKVGFTTDGTSVATFGVAGTGSGGLTLAGTTSGSATIGVAAAAGTPAQINLPTATGAAGTVLTTNGGSPQQLSWSAAGSGTVTSVATTAPITGGTITTTGTIACATCVTSAAALTSPLHVFGQGSQAVAVVAYPDIQTFTSDGTWTKPTAFTPKTVTVICIGAGGSGGGGSGQAVSNLRVAGAGGGGGARIDATFLASDLGATEEVNVGVGPAGGGGGTGANGTNGTVGEVSCFSTAANCTGTIYLMAGGGGLGGGGQGTAGCTGGTGGGNGVSGLTSATCASTNVTGGGNNVTGAVVGTGNSGAGGSNNAAGRNADSGGASAGGSSNTGGAGLAGGCSMRGGSGGGGGGGVTNANPGTQAAGAAGGDDHTWNSTSGVGAACGGGGGNAGPAGGASPGGAGNPGILTYGGEGGGGGGGNNAGTAGAGGDGGVPGGGGGGGGAGTNVGAGGGAGANGKCWVITY